MASSFSIADILTHDKATSSGFKRSPTASPDPPTLPAQAKTQPSLPEVIEVRVLDSNGGAEKGVRKKSRDSTSLSSCSDTSISSKEASPSDSIEGEVKRRSKRPRTAFTTTQLKGLEHYFKICPYPDSMGRDVISRVTSIDDARIQVWFQNRRARYRKREQPLSKPHSSLSPGTTPPTRTPPRSHTGNTPKALASSTLASKPTSVLPSAPAALPNYDPELLTRYYTAAIQAFHLQQASAAYVKPSPPSTLAPLSPFQLPLFFPVVSAPSSVMEKKSDS